MRKYAVKLDPALAEAGVLIEPTAVVGKAWEQIERIGARPWFEPRTVLVTGTGPVGLLAALLGAQRALEVHVFDRVVAGPKVDLSTSLGATYHSGDAGELMRRLRPDVVIEATGAAAVVWEVLTNTARYGITCSTGISAAGRTLPADLGGLNGNLVLENDVVVGSVNANLRISRSPLTCSPSPTRTGCPDW